MNERMWTFVQAAFLCRAIERIAPIYGCHVALTGGTLYKDGERKDVDILFYRIRQADKINVDGLFDSLAAQLGIVRQSGFGWCIKATYEGKAIDCFFPEENNGPDYPQLGGV